jgi:hypothetical protein
MKMYPSDYKPAKQIPLQSYLFGHRIQDSQTKYEYLIEFLQVAISPKALEYNNKHFTEMFPVDEDGCDHHMKYYPVSRIGLKRFVFFPKSKMDGKAEVDKKAYDECLKAIEQKMSGGNPTQYKNAIAIMQNLLNGFSAVNQNRSWFDQNMLPVCPEVILPEGMGIKSWRQKMDFQQCDPNIDSRFDFKKYTYMCRGGEIYYLHLLNAINEQPQYRDTIEIRLREMITSFPQFSCLCNFIQNTWEDFMAVSPDDKPILYKDLGAIPDSFKVRNKYTLEELENFLNSKCHPFEKMEIYSNGLILQMLRMMYLAASTDSSSNCWLIDVNCKSFENQEMKKAAINAFKRNEETISTYLYSGMDELGSMLMDDPSEETKLIKAAADDSYRLFRKLGKSLGIIIPNTGSGMRFTISEDIVKFLVLSIIPPKHMITLDEFINLLYEHYGMVIAPAQYKKEMVAGSLKIVNDLSFMEENKNGFAQKLKECGFLRDLSDATSIVENPYDKED